jgi:hypothetical protein
MEEININYNFSGFFQIYTGIGGFLIYGSRFFILKDCSAESFLNFCSI